MNKQMSMSFLHDEVNLYGDSGYIGAEKRQDAIVRNKQGKKIRYKQNREPTQIKKLFASGQRRAKKAEHKKSSVRAKVEHVFAVIKGGSGIEKRDTEVCQTEYAVRAGELGYG